MIVRRERPHPGAQLSFTDHDGYRFQAILTDQTDPNIAVLERRHRQRARVEDRIRDDKDTGLAKLPFKQFALNEVWVEIVMLAQFSESSAVCARWRALLTPTVVVPSSSATSDARHDSTSRRRRTARCRGGRFVVAATIASRRRSRASARSKGSRVGVRKDLPVAAAPRPGPVCARRARAHRGRRWSRFGRATP